MPRAPRAAPKISETAEHLTVAGYIKKVGLGDGAVMWHNRGERAGARQRITATRMGVLSGLPDWTVLHAGTIGFIELKPRGWTERRRKRGRYTTHELKQLAVQNRLQLAGAWTETCETLEDVLATLKQHGVPLRAETLSAERIKRGFRRGIAAGLSM